MKRFSIILCALLLISMLGACGSSPAENTKSNADEPIAEESVSQQGTDSNVSTPEDNTGSATTQDLPDDPEEMQTISFTTSYYNAADNTWESPDRSPVIDTLEEATNVHVEWNIITAEEAYSLMLASGDYSDLIAPMIDYPGGWGKAVEDGVFMELTDVVENYMPNYTALLESNDTIRREAVADDGSMPVVYTITCDDAGQPITSQQSDGLMIRGDWVDKLGVDLPETIDDWEKVLSGFKDEFGATAPLLIGTDGTLQCGAFMSAYGVLSEFYVDGETVKYGPVEEGYRQWLELFRDWYERGLIDKDYPVSTDNNKLFASMEKLGGGVSGAGNQLIPMSDQTLLFMGMATDPEFVLLPMQNPVLKKGDVPTRAEYNSYLYDAMAFSSTCENVQAAARWLDYLYSFDGMLLSNYGLEGDGFYYDEDGNIQLTDEILNPPAGVLGTDMLSLYNLGLKIGLSNTEIYNKTLTPNQAEGIEMLSAMDHSMELPSTISLSVDESTEISNIYGDIQTYAAEMTNKFITGAVSMDEYDDFVDALYNMNLQDCIDAYQGAYDRFLAR